MVDLPEGGYEPSLPEIIAYVRNADYNYWWTQGQDHVVAAQARGFWDAINLLKKAAGEAYAKNDDRLAQTLRDASNRLESSGTLGDLVKAANTYDKQPEIDHDEAKDIWTEFFARHGVILDD